MFNKEQVTVWLGIKTALIGFPLGFSSQSQGKVTVIFDICDFALVLLLF